MYDKSKKTWSQRLKIQKNDKSPISPNASSVTATGGSPSYHTSQNSFTQFAESSSPSSIGHNASLRSPVPAQYQLSPANLMHLSSALTLNEYHGSGGGMAATYDFMTGRTMKYAEPWIYGTVRGIPARPAGLYHPAYAAAYANHPHAAAIFAAPTEAAVAVVLCSCSEYLSGTKGRTLKKASVCKKCKGTRLPLANIGGTVRVAGTMSNSNKQRPMGASATLRVVSSTKKQRPTILDPQKDPYDLMRRTRLLSPEPGGGMSKATISGGSKDKSRSRGKSASPVRGRTRTRHQQQQQKALSTTTNDTGKVMETVDDSWLTESEDLSQTPSTSNSRKSILRCNVNPYDLISINAQKSSGSLDESYATNQAPSSMNGAESSKKSRKQQQKVQYSQNEFMPPNDDFNVQDAALTEDDPPFYRQTKSKADHKKTEPTISNKQREESLHKSRIVHQASKSKKPNYSNVQAIAGQRISLGAEQQSSKSLIQQSADGVSTYESFSVENITSKAKEDVKTSKTSRPATLQVSAVAESKSSSPVEPKRPPRSNNNKQHTAAGEVTNDHLKKQQEDDESAVTVTVTPTYNIKSILKRPLSKSSENSDVSQTDSPSSKASTPSTPKLRESELNSSTPPTSGKRHHAGSSPTTSSQFYIPMPQARKKVQFMVDDRINDICVVAEERADDDEPEFDILIDTESDGSSGDIDPQALAANYEYYTRKQTQNKLQIDEDPQGCGESVGDDNQVVTYDEQFIQAMLLEKLQLDSEMVTKSQQHLQQLQQQQQQNHITTTLHIKEDEREEHLEHGNGEIEVKKSSDTSQHVNKSHYENRNTSISPESQNSTSSGRSTDVSISQPQQLNSHANCNTDKRNPATANEPTPKSLTLSTLPLSAHNVMKLKGNNIVVDSNDEDLSGKDKCILVLNENGVNTPDGPDGDNTADKNDEDDAVAHIVSTFFPDGHNDGHKDSHDINDDVYDGANGKTSITDNGEAMQLSVIEDQDGHAGVKNHGDDDGNGYVSSIAAKAQHYGATKSTAMSPTVTSISSGVYNDRAAAADDDAGTTSSCGPEVQDDVKSRQQQKQQQKHQNNHHHHHHYHHQHQLQQQLQQRQQQILRQQQQQRQTESQKCNKKKMKKDMQTLPAASGTTDSTRTSTSVKAGTVGSRAVVCKEPTKETQSRNPIRRSQSERQQPTSLTHHQQNNKNNKNYFKSVTGSVHKEDDADDDDDDDVEKDNTSSSRNIKPNISNSLKDTLLAIPIARNKINGSVGNNGELNFHDTMALRKRCNRNDTRDLFTMGPVGRPREPPPPPPPSINTSTTSVIVGTAIPKEDFALVLKAAHLEKPSEVITSEADGIESRQQQTVNDLVSQQQKTTIGQANTGNGNENGSDSSKEHIDKPRQQQQQLGHQKKVKNAASNTHVVNNEDLSHVVNDGTNLTASQPKQQQQRTVVRVAPFNTKRNSFDVHRLKITHIENGNDVPSSPKTPSTPGSTQFSSHYSVTDLSTLNSTSPDYGQQKTSILITGDDCYNTMNLSCDDSATPHYQSSVVVTDGSCRDIEGVRMINSCNTVTINVSSPRGSEDELIHQHNQLNNLLKRQSKSVSSAGSIRAIIPIRGTIDVNLQRSASSTSSTSTSSMTSNCSSTSSSTGCTSKRGKTFIRLDYEKEKLTNLEAVETSSGTLKSPQESEWLPHETELLKILRNPVEAVKRNLVPHICKLREDDTQKDSKRSKKMKDGLKDMPSDMSDSLVSSTTPSLRSPLNSKSLESHSFIGKLLEDPMLNQVAEGLESDTVAELIENSLKRLQETRNSLDMSGTKDNDDMSRLIDLALKRIQEERVMNKEATSNTSAPPHSSVCIDQLHTNSINSVTKDEERISNRGSISSANSFSSAHNYELFDFDANESDCYQSCSSEINSMLEDDVGSSETKSRFYQMLVDATLQEIELSTNVEDLSIDEHQYESIRHNIDPIYEEISDVPPPLPLTAPPLNDPELEKKSARSIFEGASKYDILSYLVDAKERGVVKEETFDFPVNCSNPIIIEEESADTLSDLGKLSKLKRLDTISSRSSVLSDSSEDNQSTLSSLSPPTANNFMLLRNKQAASDIERNDSGVGSETSKTSRSKFLNPSHNSSITSSFSSTKSSSHSPQPRNSPLHLCEDCDGAVETQLGEDGVMFAPLVCRKCGKKRVERKEIITEIVETEEKYGRDLQIILEEFCQPMLVAGLLTQEQLSAIFLNTEELLENNQTLAERMRDGLDIALEQGDDDLLTVNIGKIFLESTQMLHAFESYCVRQAGASLLLANLEKEKELLRIFLKVSQMENAVLRRMNLNSFLMVPVQRVTKYPLLLARLYKVTPSHLEGRDLLKQAQEKIELHLNHINQEAKDVPTKLWRRISSSSPNRRASCEIDMINIKLRKMAIDVLEWNHDEVRFVMEGKLLYTQPTDSNWKKARTIKLTSVNALLVTNGKPSTNYKAEKLMSDKVNFPKHTGIREASLLVVKEKCGRYALIREPLYLDRCVVCSEADWDEYFEIQEISSKDTFIFKAEDNARTKQWYTQLQYHAQGMGAWRKRRNALANIMINGMLTRT